MLCTPCNTRLGAVQQGTWATSTSTPAARQRVYLPVYVATGARHCVRRAEFDGLPAEECGGFRMPGLGHPAENLLPFVCTLVAEGDQTDFRSRHRHFSMCRGKPWIERPPSG